MNSRFLRPAEDELIAAANYYESQANGLGVLFLDKIDSAVQDIETHPYRWPVIRNNVRRRVILQFPYFIMYRIVLDEVVILAVMHQRRQPEYWVPRI
ncbi:MAG: type II toxin-antitoxin system RelE/ParE family toxin [Fibrobacteres bacterium]|nr:type II toxin-antitoxin system RelE/ParE family toxin [Fibrobacterota bacterium]